MSEQQLRVGSPIRIPWGVNRWIPGTVLYVWGDPPEWIKIGYVINGDARSLVLEPKFVEAA